MKVFLDLFIASVTSGLLVAFLRITVFQAIWKVFAQKNSHDKRHSTGDKGASTNILCTAIPPGEIDDKIISDAKQCIAWAADCTPFLGSLDSYGRNLGLINIGNSDRPIQICTSDGTAEIDFCVGNSLQAASVPNKAVVIQYPIDFRELTGRSEQKDEELWLKLHGRPRKPKITHTRLLTKSGLEIQLGNLVVLKLDEKVKDVYVKEFEKLLPAERNGLTKDMFDRKVRVFGGVKIEPDGMKIITFRGENSNLERGKVTHNISGLLSVVVQVESLDSWKTKLH